MKIATTLPLKVALVAASITTIGVIALHLADTDPAPVVRDHCELRKREPAPPPPPPQLSVDDYAAPGATVAL